MKTAIITSIDDNMIKNFEDGFLDTLRNTAKYKGEIYVIYYGKDKKNIKRLEKKYSIKIVQRTRELKIVNQRFKDYLNLFEDIPEITNVMFIDSGDVWFQAPIDEIFEITQDSYGFVEEDEKADKDFNLSSINQILDKKIRYDILRKLKKTKLINGGMIVGKKNTVKEIIRSVVDLINKINQDFFGLDQTVMNYVIRLSSRGIRLPSKYNLCLFLNIDSFEIIENKIYNENGELVKIVHNNGNNSRIFPEGIQGMKKINSIPKFPKKLPGSFWGITTLFNPCSYKSRLRNYKIFREKSKKQGLNLIAVELAFGNQPFSLCKDDAEILIQLRTDSILWHKERLLNIGMKKLPEDCDKFCWIDADIIFMNDNWIKETCKLLEDYPVIQPFSYIFHLKNGESEISSEIIPKFIRKYKSRNVSQGVAFRVSQLGVQYIKRDRADLGYVGICWAFRREIFNETGLYDKNILSSSDALMTCSFYNISSGYFFYISSNKHIRDLFKKWESKIYPEIKGSVCFRYGIVAHLYHGSLKDRGYLKIENLLRRNDFNPEKDLILDENDCYKWTDNNPQLRKEIENYFISRNDDELLYNKIKSKLNENLFLIFSVIGRIGGFIMEKDTKDYYNLKKVYYLGTLKKEFGIKDILLRFWNDYQMDYYPTDRRMNLIDYEKVEGMNSENVRFLINEIVRNFARKGIYLEVGTHQGSSLISAALYNDSALCIGIDDFSMFNYWNYEKKIDRTLVKKDNEKKLKENLEEFNFLKNIKFYKGDYKKVIPEIFSKNPDLKVNVYFYDGNHSYGNQLNGLNIILPFLSEKCIIIVDDLNYKRVEKANNKFLKENPDFKSLFKIKTSGNCHPLWWNGIEIIGRGINF